MRRSAGPETVPPRVVLDTNVVVSALLFSGRTAPLLDHWQSGRFAFLVSGPIFEEYLKVLSYPKFNLTEREIRGLVDQELLPFVETVRISRPPSLPRVRDPGDRKFLECAAVGRADFLVTGDTDLLVLRRIGRIPIVTPADLLTKIKY